MVGAHPPVPYTLDSSTEVCACACVVPFHTYFSCAYVCACVVLAFYAAVFSVAPQLSLCVERVGERH